MKVRFYSFLFFVVALFIFLTSIPGRFWQQTANQIPSKEKILDLDVGLAESPYKVLVDRTQIFPTNIPEEELYPETSFSPAAPSSSQPSSATFSTANQETIPSASFGRENSAQSSPQSSMDIPGSYPESHILDGIPHGNSSDMGNEDKPNVSSGNSSSLNAPSSTAPLPSSETYSSPESSLGSGSVSPTPSASVSPSPLKPSSEKQELEISLSSSQVQAFLNESPMVQKDQEMTNPLFRKVSQRGGFDVIPEHSGINGRSIYGPREHFIEEGDSLPKLASRYLGDPNRENEIFEMNRHILPNSEELPIGQILLIPEKY